MKFFKNNLYLIIPAICISFWAVYPLYQVMNFITNTYDFTIFYNSGKQIFKNPTNLYEDPDYIYMPNFSLLFSVSFSLLPISTAANIFFLINYIIGILTIIEFNKILTLMDIKQKIHRFIFLIIISNGYFIFNQFRTNQTKYITLVIFLFIIRREFQFNKYQIEKDLKYYLINYNLFIFSIGMAPNFLFLFLIYIFQDVSRNEIFKKENIKKYSIAFLIGIIQNFLFIIFPILIFDFINGINRPHKIHNEVELLYLRGWVELSASEVRNLVVILTIILGFISFIMMFNDKLAIEEKFGYFALAYLLIGIHGSCRKLPLILLHLILFLFIPYLNQDFKKFKFIKNNSILLIGLLSISIITFLSHYNIIYEFIPSLFEYPLVILNNLRYLIFIIIMITSLILLKLKEYKKQDFNID